MTKPHSQAVKAEDFDSSTEGSNPSVAANLYLIAHKVRGEPAFDIAMRCDDMGTATDPGPWWIVPTSGHRAYPYWYIPLDQLYPEELIDPLFADSVGDAMSLGLIRCPDDWPDFYNDPGPRSTGLDLKSILGLKPQPIERRF